MKIKLTLCLFCLISLSGCADGSILAAYREVEDLELIRAVAVDLAENGDVTITAGTAASKESPPRFYKSTGHTLSEAINRMQRLPLGKKALFSHTAHFVFSEEAARAGIGEYLDYIQRSPDMQPDTYLFIARGSAVELMTAISGKESGAAEELSFLAENLPSLGTGCAFTCRQAAASLSSSGCALIQSITAQEQAELFEGQAKAALMPSGFGVMTGEKLTVFLDETQTAGSALIAGGVKTKTLTAPVGEALVTFLLTPSGAKFEPVISSGELIGAKVKIKAHAMVLSVKGDITISREEALSEAEEAIARQLQKETMAALRASQTLRVDFLAGLKCLSIKAPKTLAPLEDNWEDVWPALSLRAEAQVTVSRTYNIRDPLQTAGEEEYALWTKRTR